MESSVNFKRVAFTLIELLVVIAIIGILSGMIVVVMGNMTQKATIAKAQVFSNSLRNALMANIIGEWKIDEISGATANDTWGRLSNGILNGFTDTTAGYGDANTSGWMSSSNCISGTCLKFNGSSTYLNCGTNAILDVDSITVSAWIKTGNSVPVDWATIIAKGNQGANNHFWLNYRTGYFSFEYGNGTARTAAVNNIVPLINTWYYIVGTYTSGSGYLYVNGARGAQNIGLSGNLGTNVLDLIIGRCSYATSYYWNGLIDDVRFFNAAMPTSQIKEQYYAGLNKLLINGGITEEEYLSRLNNYASNN